MPVIDADTHVIETESTWDFMPEADAVYKPAIFRPPNPDPTRDTVYWKIEGLRYPRIGGNRDDAATNTTVATRELLDVPARMRQMDELGVDIQVVFPSLFLQGLTADPKAELALRRSYNRWLASRCEASKGRLRWICLPPMLSMDEVEKELRFAKDHGACGVAKIGGPEAGRWPNDPYFFPLFEAAERFDMPLCFHIGTGMVEHIRRDQFLYGRAQRHLMAVQSAFHSMVLFGIPQKFPKLRFGFIEAGAGWVPYILSNLKRRSEKIEQANKQSFTEFDLSGNVLTRNRLYVTCQVDEDLPYLLSVIGEDNLMTGSDYSHADASRENGFIDILGKRAANGEISRRAVDKMLYDNPKAFYGL